MVGGKQTSISIAYINNQADSAVNSPAMIIRIDLQSAICLNFLAKDNNASQDFLV